MRWRPLPLALAVALVAAACTAGTPPAPVGPAAESPRPGGRVVEGAISDLTTLQPVLAVDAVSNRLLEKIYEQLITFDPKSGEPKPNLARWTISPDGLTYTFDIEESAKWSDGKPVIAEDWLTGTKATARSKKTTRQTLFQDIVGFAEYRDGKAASISGIQAEGKRLTVRFTKVFCPALSQTFAGYVLPTHVFGKYTGADAAASIDDAPENIAPPVSSGPFLFKEWRAGDQVVLVRNAEYWRGAPLLDEYVLKIVASADALVTQLKSGELDLATVEPKDVEDLGRDQRLRIYRFPALAITFIGWNTRAQNAPALADKRVRQALAYGLDTETIVRSVVFGEGIKMTAHHPPVSWAAASGLNDYKYDRAKAEELIRSAGYSKGTDGFFAKDGKPLAFTINATAGNKLREAIVQVAVEQYRQIGVKAEALLEPLATQVGRISTGSRELDAYLIGLNLGFDPDVFAQWHSSTVPDAAANRRGFNGTGFSSPELDRAIEQGRSGDCSVAARKRAYEQVNRILNEEQPYNFGFAPNTLVAAPAALRNVDPGTFGIAHNVHRWWWDR